MFSYPVFLWFLPVLGLVVLIHLINMFRHRRVEWAALEFLLAGYRKSRMRILFQQLLLMLLRTLAAATMIFMFASPKLEGTFADWFNRKPTHHLILLDDSFSMNDRNTALGNEPLFNNALQVIRRIVEDATRHGSDDRLTLVRLSRAVSLEKGEEPDIAELLLRADNLKIIENSLKTLQPSQSAEEPEKLLAAAVTLIRQSKIRMKPVAYFLSDFRKPNWDNPASALKNLEEIRQLGGMVRMIRMTDQERPNFSIDRLELVDGIHAAEVDLLLDVKITNRSQEDAENIPVLLLINGQTQSNQTIPKLKAGEQTTPPVRFSVRLNGSGQHRIEVQLQPDTIPDDNRRFLVLNVPEALEVLLISPQTTASDSSALYVRVALSPGGAKSGIRTRIEPPSFLTTKPLNPFNAVFLIDIPLLEPAAVKALEEYVAKGGGVAFFPGQESNLDFLRNELYKNGTGLFPVAPIAETPLDPNFLTKTPDIAVSNHPIFRLFGEGESPLLGSVKIERYLGIEPITPVKDPIQPPQSPQLPKILATLRNGAPLVLEKEFGKGKTVTFLTTAAPVWNNWGRGNPGFVVVMLELAAWLSKRPNETLPVLVGDPINISLDPTLFEQKFVMQRLSNETDSTNFVLESVLREDAGASAVFSQTDQAGFYEAVLKEFSGNEVRKAFAVNVNAKEGDIFLSDVSKLSDLLRSANQSLESAAGFSTAADFSGQQPLTDFLLYAVLTLLIAETFLAGRIIPPLKSR